MTRREYVEKLKKLGPYTKMKLNRLAAQFYQIHGYNPDDIDFLLSSHPQEQLMFQLAVIANEFFQEEDN